MEEKIIISKEGLKALKEEYEYLVTKRREEIKAALEYARSLGDLSENADYDAARKNQAENEAKIEELRKKIENAEVIDDNFGKNKDVVGLYKFVTFLNLKTKQERTVEIVGETEANPDANRISNESPLGKALLNKKKGEVASVECKNKYDVKVIDFKSKN